MIFCGIFDGHGPWGHYVAKRVRESMPSSLLCNWQESLAQMVLDPDFDLEVDKKMNWFSIWKRSYLKTCASVDQELEQHRKIDTFYSGTTALSIVRQVIHKFISLRSFISSCIDCMLKFLHFDMIFPPFWFLRNSYNLRV